MFDEFYTTNHNIYCKVLYVKRKLSYAPTFSCVTVPDLASRWETMYDSQGAKAEILALPCLE